MSWFSTCLIFFLSLPISRTGSFLTTHLESDRYPLGSMLDTPSGVYPIFSSLFVLPWWRLFTLNTEHGTKQEEMKVVNRDGKRGPNRKHWNEMDEYENEWMNLFRLGLRRVFFFFCRVKIGPAWPRVTKILTFQSFRVESSPEQITSMLIVRYKWSEELHLQKVKLL